MDADFAVTEVLRDNCRVLVLEGELDMKQTSTLDAALDEGANSLPVVVDLTSLTFLDSSGLHALLRNRDAGRPAALVRAPGSSVARVLDIVSAYEAVRLYDDLTAAIEQLGTP